MKKTLALFAAVALVAGANAEDKIVIKGSDTLGAKMVPQLAEAYKEAGNEVSFEIAAEGSSSAFTNLLAGTADKQSAKRSHVVSASRSTGRSQGQLQKGSMSA